ncbi:class I mannose-6-phosphate isomerase [Hydrogenoanaerobacterium sp.]|uniref:class I mannose-6-phosphate isomerase n=1 Tax=Hydrogenoanaerobacterium sp. TaxID=2953763 RepID=UPI00289A8027|nr:class I mannose-6-phosphate isomerase [Hydrogenoanaerobacterium sp.]
MNQNDYKKLAENPIFFERNRVFRVYQGGKLFHDFFGDEAVDGNYPEEWIASDVKALNQNSSDPREGVSRIRGTDVYFDDLMKAERASLLGDRESFGILVKALDSAIRLPIQAHPDKAFSQKHFSSDYGKAESWLILATRENARIYFGYKNEVTEEEFLSAIERSETDKGAMEELLNEVPVHKGDVFFVPAKVVHAIGYGCLILEIQEPTDFTVQPEAWCGDYHLSDYEKYLGLSQETALKCFDYTIYGDKAEQLGRKTPRILSQTDSVTSEALISTEDTPCFSVNRHRVQNGSLCLKQAPSVYIVTEGEGCIKNENYRQNLKKGDYFFLPYAAKGLFRIETSGQLELIECLPPQKEV